MPPVRLRPVAVTDLTDARRRVVRRFPYVVIYLVEPEHIEVLAVFHTSRDPKQWQGRLGS